MTEFTYQQTTTIKCGEGIVRNIGEIVAAYGTRCLLVSEPIFDAVKPAFDLIIDQLKTQGVEVYHFDQVKPNPPTTVVEAGVTMAHVNCCDVVLAVGGGSSIDSAKIISAAATIKDIDWEHWFSTYDNPFNVQADLPDNKLPLIAVPTTSGTGSQVTPAAVISDEAKKAKITLFHPGLSPDVAVVDPELMLTLPPRMTAITGFDAFSHAFESFVGNRPSPFVDLASMKAMQLIVEYLPTAVKNGSDINARSNMALADTLAGIGLSNGGAGAPHPIGEIIGGKHPHIPHGLTLAVVYPEYVRTQYHKSPHRYALVAQLFGALGDNDEEKAAQLPELLEQFLLSIGLVSNLNGIGFTEHDVKEVCDELVFNLPTSSSDEMRAIVINSFMQ